MSIQLCHFCQNLLQVEFVEDSGVRHVRLVCPLKHYCYAVRTPVETTTPLEWSEPAAVVATESMWDNAAMIDMTCEKCGNKRCYYTQMQTRSADEPETIKYCCTRCKYIWTE